MPNEPKAPPPPVSRTQVDKDRIFFFHIPKCAGMTVWSCIWDSVGKRDTYQVGIKQQRLAFESMTSSEIKKFRAIGGHGYLDIFTQRLQPYARYLSVTVIRDPIERVISEYNFIAGNAAHVRHSEVSGMSFEEFCEPGKHMANMITRLLVRDPDPKAALDVLETRFDAWFLLPEVNRLNQFIREHFRLPIIADGHENRSAARVRRDVIDAGLLAQLVEYHSADVSLYQQLVNRERGGLLAERFDSAEPDSERVAGQS